MPIAQIQKTKFGRSPENHILAQARDVHAKDRDGREQLAGEIAVGNGIHAVRADFGKSKFPGNGFPIQNDRRASNGTGSERHRIHPLGGIRKAARIAVEHLHIGKKMVGEKNWLSALEVSVARH